MKAPLNQNIQRTNIVCPKCKSDSLAIMEIWDGAVIEWEIINGKFDRNDGSLEPGNPVKLECKCKNCHHSWKIRKSTQIDDIIS